MIDQLHQIAEERGGLCLSDTYKGSGAKLLWQCANKHQWLAAPAAIKRGTWCPYCAKRAKRTIEEMHQIAEERGGKCLSEIYINNATKLLWECSEGHKWQAVPLMIFRGFWCIRCVSSMRSKRRKERGLGACRTWSKSDANPSERFIFRRFLGQ